MFVKENYNMIMACKVLVEFVSLLHEICKYPKIARLLMDDASGFSFALMGFFTLNLYLFCVWSTLCRIVS